MLSFLGKVLIIAGICFQAHLLFNSETVSKDFDLKLTAALTACDCIPAHISVHILQYARFVVVGLMASSILMLVFKCWLLKVFVILGLSVILYIQHQPLNKIPCCGDIDLWRRVAFIGGLIYLMGAECSSGSCTPKPEVAEQVK